jgi:hypothetical protein
MLQFKEKFQEVDNKKIILTSELIRINMILDASRIKRHAFPDGWL